VEVVDEEASDAAVEIVVAETLDKTTVRTLQQIKRSGSARPLLVIGRMEESALPTAIECGVQALVRRQEANQDRLVEAVLLTARGDGCLPPDLLGRLLDQVGRLQRHLLDPRGLSLSGLSEREVDVLHLLSEGFETGEIATKLSYSERTVKNILHGVTSRLQLRNRAHAVGYALRQGLI
jgi:DNA-binding NarL/FixJ family response regulator